MSKKAVQEISSPLPLLEPELECELEAGTAGAAPLVVYEQAFGHKGMGFPHFQVKDQGLILFRGYGPYLFGH